LLGWGSRWGWGGVGRKGATYTRRVGCWCARARQSARTMSTTLEVSDLYTLEIVGTFSCRCDLSLPDSSTVIRRDWSAIWIFVRFPMISQGYTRSSSIASCTCFSVRLRGRTPLNFFPRAHVEPSTIVRFAMISTLASSFFSSASTSGLCSARKRGSSGGSTRITIARLPSAPVAAGISFAEQNVSPFMSFNSSLASFELVITPSIVFTFVSSSVAFFLGSLSFKKLPPLSTSAAVFLGFAAPPAAGADLPFCGTGGGCSSGVVRGERRAGGEGGRGGGRHAWSEMVALFIASMRGCSKPRPLIIKKPVRTPDIV
jgi:hypothetical protein